MQNAVSVTGNVLVDTISWAFERLREVFIVRVVMSLLLISDIDR